MIRLRFWIVTNRLIDKLDYVAPPLGLLIGLWLVFAAIANVR